MADLQAARATALIAAAILLGGSEWRQPNPQLVLRIANSHGWVEWLTGQTAQLVLTMPPVATQQHKPSVTRPLKITNQGGRPVATLPDNFQFTASVQPEDSQGQPTSDTLTWTVTDTAIAVAQPSPDTLSCTFAARGPGTTTYTVSDASGVSATGQIQVTAGAATQLVITESAPVPQPAPPAPAPAGP